MVAENFEVYFDKSDKYVCHTFRTANTVCPGLIACQCERQIIRIRMLSAKSRETQGFKQGSEQGYLLKAVWRFYIKISQIENCASLFCGDQIAVNSSRPYTSILNKEQICNSCEVEPEAE